MSMVTERMSKEEFEAFSENIKKTYLEVSLEENISEDSQFEKIVALAEAHKVKYGTSRYPVINIKGKVNDALSDLLLDKFNSYLSDD